MLKRYGWICLLTAFALAALSFFLVFERLEMQGPGASQRAEFGFTGLSLAMSGGDGGVTVDDVKVSFKKLTGINGGERGDQSYVYALMFLCACVGMGVALLDRAGRRKAVSGIICALLSAGLSVWLIAVMARGRAWTADGLSGVGFTSLPGAGLFVCLGLNLIALGLSVMTLAGTPSGAQPDEKTRTLTVTRVGVLAAISGALFTLPGIPVFPPIYKLDFSSVPVLLAGFSMGPVPGLCVLLIKDLIGLLSSSSGGVGELADFVTAAALMLPASVMYRRTRTFRTALIGLVVGIFGMALTGALVNYFIMIPFYVNVMGLKSEAIVGMMAKIVPAIDSMPKLILLATTPFNLLKGAVLTFITLILYKRLSPILKSV